MSSSKVTYSGAEKEANHFTCGAQITMLRGRALCNVQGRGRFD